MLNCIRTSDRRKEKRYSLKEDAVVDLDPGIGQILDISVDGLAFCYMSSSERCFKEQFKLDILYEYSGGRSFHLGGVSCKVIANSEIDNGLSYEELGNEIKNKRCGVQFVELTQKQSLLLEQFIAKCANCEV